MAKLAEQLERKAFSAAIDVALRRINKDREKGLLEIVDLTEKFMGDNFTKEAYEGAPAMRPMMGSFAPQGMKVVVMIVILRSRSFSMVRDAMTPGTPQPVPMSIGMKDFPESPNLRKIRSIMNAIRAM